MKAMGMQCESLHLGRGDGDARRVATLVQFRSDAQPGGRTRATDQGDHRLEGAEGPPAPVLRDVTEQPVLDLVPFAGARRKVRHMNAQAEIGGEALQTVLPGSRPVAIAT